MKCGVLAGSHNYEPPQTLRTPTSRFQLTFKLDQMAFKKYSLPIGESGSLWRLQPPARLRKWWESCYGHLLLRRTPHGPGYSFRVCELFMTEALAIYFLVLGFQISLRSGYLLWIVAGLISLWDQGEIKLIERLHLFAYWPHKLNMLSLKLPSFSFPCSFSSPLVTPLRFYPEIAPVSTSRLREVSFICPKTTRYPLTVNVLPLNIRVEVGPLGISDVEDRSWLQ